LLSTPVAWNRLVEGRDREQDEIDSEIAKAEAEIARMPRGGSQ
jgi:hypothetical protein